MNSIFDESEFAADERSISEVLGYIIVFSLVITAVITVVLGGLTAVEDGRDAERAMNAERAFDILGENMGAIYERGAPSRATELDLGNSELFYGTNVTMSVYDGTTGGTLLVERNITPVRMNVVDERGMIYAGGAVFRRSEGGGVTMVRDPPFRLEEPVHIPVVQTTAPSVESAGGTVVLLRAVGVNRTVHQSGPSGSGFLTLEIESPRYEAWASGLRDASPSTVSCTTDPSNNIVECEIPSNLPGVVISHEIAISILL